MLVECTCSGLYNLYKKGTHAYIIGDIHTDPPSFNTLRCTATVNLITLSTVFICHHQPSNPDIVIYPQTHNYGKFPSGVPRGFRLEPLLFNIYINVYFGSPDRLHWGTQIIS